MRKPEELKAVTDEVLAGLSATDELKKKILYSAANTMLEKEDGKTEKRKKNGGWVRVVPALCCALVLVVCAAVIIPEIKDNTEPVNDIDFPEIQEMAAGNYSVSEEVPVLASTKVSNSGMRVSVGQTDGIFTGEMQVVECGGKFYRLTENLFGEGILELTEAVGKVEVSGEYTEIVNGNKNGSNVLEEGTELYKVKGMNDAWLAAVKDGKVYVFQRISVENKGLSAGEKITDVMPSFERVVSIEIEGKEKITDPEKIRAIGDTLKEYAVPEDNGAVYSGEMMVLNMDNGMKYQVVLDGERICMCGTWVCPEFFEMIQ